MKIRRQLRAIAAGAFGLWLSSSPGASAASFPDRFDRQIQRAAENWLPGVPWRLLKAQYWQESRLKTDARSPLGAEGIAQFMPGTWIEVRGQMRLAPAPRNDAGASIEAGAYYMSRLRAQWRSERPERDRHSLAMASYNAGLGHILAAQRACAMPVHYEPIMACLPGITGRHAAETLGYAPAIYRWFQRMELAR